jgi:hypothetical protein
MSLCCRCLHSTEHHYMGHCYGNSGTLERPTECGCSGFSSPPKLDPVNHPPHYTEGRSIEVIDVLEDWNLDFRLSNVIKYVARAGKKAASTKLEDLKKAAWYLNRVIEKEESEK